MFDDFGPTYGGLCLSTDYKKVPIRYIFIKLLLTSQKF